MDSEQNIFHFNPRHCENRLSVFGKKVLNVLIHKRNCDQGRARNACQQQYTPSIQNRSMLYNKESFRSTPDMICTAIRDETVSHNNSSDFDPMERNLPPVPTNLQLVQTVEMSKDVTALMDTNIPSLGIVNQVMDCNRSIDPHLFTRAQVNDLINHSKPIHNSGVDTNDPNDIDWNNMFDSELFSDSESVIENAGFVLKQIETPISKDFNIELPFELAPKITQSSSEEKGKKTSQHNIKKSKQKGLPITDVIPKKVKKVSVSTDVSYRKQKYTKTVKNWLDDVDPNNPVEKDDMDNIVTDQNNAQKKIEITFDTITRKCNKKVVQAQLANKDGKMKFKKPKANEIKEQGHDTVETPIEFNDKTSASTTNLNKKNQTVKESDNEKKIKPKFIVPIKSQIPVKDMIFKVIIVNKTNIKDYSETLKCIEHQELVMVLIYSNGFSQLNYHHTDDTCDAEGVIININEEHFYFKESCVHYKEILQSLLEKNKIVCYEGKALLIHLSAKLDLDIFNIDIVDVKIGGSILNSDNPPENFSELQNVLSFTPEYTIATECILQKAAWYVSLLKECGSKLISLLMEEQVWNIFIDIEMKLLPIIAEMERRGVAVDLQKLKSMKQILLAKMKSTEVECHKAAGKSFQINSTVQVRTLIYDELQLDNKCNVKIRETDKGAKSTSESMLRSLVSSHPLPKLILEYRHLHKAHATFVTGIAEHVKDGIVKPNWLQTAAVTGRIASNNPNLQAIPKTPFSLLTFPEDIEQQVLSFRSVYVARKGHTLLAADFKHVECRVFAHAAADTDLLVLLRGDQDLFRVLAHKWLKKPESEVSAEDRERTKRIVYASLYGAGCSKLMEILDVSSDQAFSIIDSFNKTFPALKNFSRSVVSRCQQSGGRVRTLCGRTRRFPNISSCDSALRAQAERQAVNFVVQGSAADLCKMAMVCSAEQLRAHAPPVDSALLLQIHDELVWELPARADLVRTAAVIIKRAMEGCGHRCGLTLPLPVSLSVGDNWGEMTEYLT